MGKQTEQLYKYVSIHLSTPYPSEPKLTVKQIWANPKSPTGPDIEMNPAP
jgi:hypothetical protein